MIRHIQTLALLAILASATPAKSADPVYEGFDYPAGSLSGLNEGDGWSSAWGVPIAGGTVGAGGDSSVESGSLRTPSDYALMPSGNHAELGHTAVARQFGTETIDLAVDATRYFSYLWNESGEGSGGNLTVSFLNNSSTSRQVWRMITAEETLSAFVNNGETSLGSVDFAAGRDYLLVGKIVSASTGPDTISFSIFESGTPIGAEPTTWQVTGRIAAADENALLNRLLLQGSTNKDLFDEFRIGDTFEEVTGVQPAASFPGR